MKHKLHYAPLDFQGEIPEFEFANLRKMAIHIQEKHNVGQRDRVFVFSYNKEDNNEDTETLITSDVDTITRFILHNKYLAFYPYFFLQEFYSFEEAYKIALEFKEGTTDLCYEDSAKEKFFEKFNENLKF